MQNKVKIYIPDHMDWISQYFSNSDIYEITNDSENSQIVVDMAQNNHCVSEKTLTEYCQKYQQIFLINAETPFDIKQRLNYLDQPQVNLLSTGVINYQPKSMKITRFENFFNEMQKIYSKLQYLPLAELKPTSKKTFYFDALLGQEKMHRNFVYEHLHTHPKIFCRYFKDTYKKQEFVWPTVAALQNNNSDNNLTTDEVNYFGYNVWISHVIPVDIYNQTAFSIITETSHCDNYVFYTEKTAKALLSSRLFVFFAGPYYLQNLHNLGFRTFSTLIDESYDTELNHKVRWQKALDQVLWLCEQDQLEILNQIQPILEHNLNVFKTTKWDYQQYLKIH
jgi:hypothetical protein